MCNISNSKCIGMVDSIIHIYIYTQTHIHIYTHIIQIQEVPVYANIM